MTQEEKAQILSGFSLFKSLDKRHLVELADSTTEKDFGAKETIIEEGEKGEDVYFIYEGSVRIYRMSPEGKEIGLAIKGKGDIAGEMALFDHGIRSAYVETIEKCKTLKLGRSNFENALKSSPEMAIELLRVLSRKVAENAETIEALSTKSLKERVTVAIKTLHSYMPRMTISQEELAALVSATRPRVSEVLSELKGEGLIEINDHEIVLRGTE